MRESGVFPLVSHLIPVAPAKAGVPLFRGISRHVRGERGPRLRGGDGTSNRARECRYVRALHYREFVHAARGQSLIPARAVSDASSRAARREISTSSITIGTATKFMLSIAARRSPVASEIRPTA